MLRSVAVAVALAFAANARAQEADPPPSFVQSGIDVLAEPQSGSARLTSLACGAPVVVVETQRSAPYARVVFAEDRSGYVVAAAIGPTQPQCAAATSTAEVPAAAISALIATARALLAEIVRNHQQVGRCQCPQDLASNGSLCGNRSAYVRLGGEDPQHCVGSALVTRP
jgi:hypothetical protein